MSFKYFTKEEINNKIVESRREIDSVKNLRELNDFEKKYLKENHSIFSIFLFNLKNIKENDKKKEFGKLINIWKTEISKKISLLKNNFDKKNREFSRSDFELFKTETFEVGGFHPVKKALFEIYDFFVSKNYKIFESEEIEDKWYNFDSLNMEKSHPARSKSDTFYLSENDNLLLRTHTSSCQVRGMEKNKNKSIMFVSAGKVYRNDDDDLTHSHQYTNFEIVKIGIDVSFSDLKWTLEEFFKWFFNKDVKTRFRPSFFPFTEPSFEVDLSCVSCEQKNIKCSTCKNTGWIEVLGAGLINPKVLKNGGYNEKKFSGFAVGIGIERILMIKHGVSDIREFYSNDIVFLKQVK